MGVRGYIHSLHPYLHRWMMMMDDDGYGLLTSPVKIGEGESKRLNCLQPECKETYPEEIVLSVLDTADAQKYAKQVSSPSRFSLPLSHPAAYHVCIIYFHPIYPFNSTECRILRQRQSSHQILSRT